MQWVPAYARKLSQRAETGFYRAMLDLTAQFVEWNAQELCGLQESPKGTTVDAEEAAAGPE
jgi:TorA maturation chaperone TorD